jgi:hypothetical protein
MIVPSPNLGEFGSVLISNTDAVTGRFSAIQVVADTVFATLQGTMTAVHGSLPTFHDGDFIFGLFTAVTLTSGAVIAHNAPPQLG